MCAPLYDSSGKIRYFLGAQVDISSIVNEGTDLESLQRLVAQKESCRGNVPDGPLTNEHEEKKDEFQQLSEMLDIRELNAVRKWGGRMLTEQQKADNGSHKLDWRRPGLLLRDPSRDHIKGDQLTSLSGGKLTASYQNVRHLSLPPTISANLAVSARSAISISTHPFRFPFPTSTRYSAITDHEQDWRKRSSAG